MRSKRHQQQIDIEIDLPEEKPVLTDKPLFLSSPKVSQEPSLVVSPRKQSDQPKPEAQLSVPPVVISLTAASGEPLEKPVVRQKKFFTRNRGEGDGPKVKPQFNMKNVFKSTFDDDFDDEPKVAISTGISGPTPSSSQSEEEEYVRLERGRKAHQCHDMGETEAFDQDIQYYLNGLEQKNSIRVRCLSIEGLSQQCMTAVFRMHLRAHDDMPKIITALSDAPKDPCLAFCTSCLMFVYNQDRLTMDIDPNHLSLMLDLLETPDSESSSSPELKNLKIKAKELVELMKSRGYGKFLDPKNLSSGQMALEALLGLTSKRAGDWMKEELRNLKGLDFLMNTIIKVSAEDRNLRIESELNKMDRTLRVLEAATYMHPVNQLYVMEYLKGQLVRSCRQLMLSCRDFIVASGDSKIYISTLLSVLRVFTNITSESAKGSHIMGTKFEGMFGTFMSLLFEIPSFVNPDSRFDLTVLLLCLSINLVEYCPDLREELLDSRYQLRSLVQILNERIREAELAEQQADEILESAEKDKLTDVVSMDNFLNQIVAKSGKHMEHSIVAACVSLLLGCCIQDHPNGKDEIIDLLPDHSFDPLIDVLRKLNEFAHLAVSCRSFFNNSNRWLLNRTS